MRRALAGVCCRVLSCSKRHDQGELAIATALAETDEVMGIAYDSPRANDVPLQVRCEWVRFLYPTVTVIEAWDGPSEVGRTPQLMRAREDYIIECLGIRKRCSTALPTRDERCAVAPAKALGVLLRSVIVERKPIYRQEEAVGGFAPGLFNLSEREMAHVREDRIGEQWIGRSTPTGRSR